MTYSHHLSREEQAKVEIGHTETTRGINWFLTVVMLAVIFAVPVWQTVRDWREIRRGAMPERTRPQSFDFLGLFPTRAELRAAAD